MKGVTRAFYTLYKYLFYAPFAILMTVLVSSLAVLLSPFVSTRVLNTHFLNRWGRILCKAVPVKVDFQGREHMDPNQSYVIVANHLSQMDIPLLYGWVGREVIWVMKQELRKMPFVGRAAGALGHIFIDRRSRAKAMEALDSAKPHLVGGRSIIFFPEGTRSEGALLPFKKGAFRVALDLGLPVLPITIVGSDLILPTNRLTINHGSIQVVVHPPIAVDTENDSEALLAEKSRAAIASALPARYFENQRAAESPQSAKKA